MCVVPAALQAYPHQGSTPLVMTPTGWAAAIAALPALPGVSILVAYPPGGGLGRCVLVTGSRAAHNANCNGLRHRWGRCAFGHGNSWQQSNDRFPQWCCMFAQLTQLSGGALPVGAVPQHPNCLAATPFDTWTYEIRWWACEWADAPDNIKPHVNLLIAANHVAVDDVPTHNDGAIGLLNMAARLLATPPCGC